jgi:hypothetical protein
MFVNSHACCCIPLRVVPGFRPGFPVSRLLDQNDMLQTHGFAAAQSRRATASSSPKTSSFTSFCPIIGVSPI